MSVQEETQKAVQFAKRALARCDDLEEEIEALRAENRELRDELDAARKRLVDVEERDAIADTVVNAKRLKVEERAAICLQTAANKAYKRKRRGEHPSAEIDYNAADTATGGVLDRRQLLDALERAAALVDSNVARYKKEPRAAKKNSRLIVDLERGELPSQVAGMDIQPGVA